MQKLVVSPFDPAQHRRRQAAHVDHRHVADAAGAEAVNAAAVHVGVHAQGHFGDAGIQHRQQRVGRHAGSRPDLDEVFPRHPAGLIPHHPQAPIHPARQQNRRRTAARQMIQQVVPGGAVRLADARQVVHPNDRLRQTARRQHLVLPVFDVTQHPRAGQLILGRIAYEHVMSRRQVGAEAWRVKVPGRKEQGHQPAALDLPAFPGCQRHDVKHLGKRLQAEARLRQLAQRRQAGMFTQRLVHARGVQQRRPLGLGLQLAQRHYRAVGRWRGARQQPGGIVRQVVGGPAVEENEGDGPVFPGFRIGALFGEKEHGPHPYLAENSFLEPQHAPHHEGPQQVVLEGGAVPHVQPAVGENEGQPSPRLEEPRAVHDEVALRIGQTRQLAGFRQPFRCGPHGFHVLVPQVAHAGRIANQRVHGRKMGGEEVAGENAGQAGRQVVRTEHPPQCPRGVGTSIDAVQLVGKPVGRGAEGLQTPGAFQQKGAVAEARVQNVVVRRAQRPAGQKTRDGGRRANEALRSQGVAHSGGLAVIRRHSGSR